MRKFIPSIAVLYLLMLLMGCGEDRDNPTPTTESDRLMESYLANVEKIGQELSKVNSAADSQAANARILLIVSDMRRLREKMEAVSEKDQADTMSKYRVKTSNINEQFAKEVARFVQIPGASEELVNLLKSMPDYGEEGDGPP